MNLCDDKTIFQQAILQASQKLNIHPAIIEKDFYVTQMLQQLVSKDPDFIFKGGTSLSKCYKVIDRFSEDIDLNYDSHNTHLSQGLRRRFSKLIKESGETLNLSLGNPEEIRSRREFNQYIFQYMSHFGSAPVKPLLIVETSIFIPSFPTEIKTVDSYLYEFFALEDRKSLISEYSLSPFPINVQTKERTFIDKIFAICDYYLTGNIAKHSRHLYDLYKLFPHIRMDPSFGILFDAVKAARKKSPVCPSAKEDSQIHTLLQEIIDKGVYKTDYEQITSKLLFEKVSYDAVISTLEMIAAHNIWIT